MTDDELKAIGKRWEGASMAWNREWDYKVMDAERNLVAECRLGQDAARIAAARQDVPALLDEIKRLKGLIDGHKDDPIHHE